MSLPFLRHNFFFKIPYVFTSFSNPSYVNLSPCLFEYHTFLHHSQTNVNNQSSTNSLSTIRFYIILKPLTITTCLFLSLSTIRFYIILKLCSFSASLVFCLSTIRFYIILKRRSVSASHRAGLSTIRFYIILKLFSCN